MKCVKHPTYQVKRKPTSKCKTCNELWNIKSHERFLASKPSFDNLIQYFRERHKGDTLADLLDIELPKDQNFSLKEINKIIADVRKDMKKKKRTKKK